MSAKRIDPARVHEPAPETRALWLEVAAVLLIGVLPELWTSAMELIWPETVTKWPSAADSTSRFLWSFQTGALVLYLMWRSSTPWAQFGIVGPRGVSDLLWFLAALFANDLVQAFYAAGVDIAVSTETLDRQFEHMAEIFPSPATPGEAALVGISQIANGFAEELVMRGYLIPRFEQLLGSSIKAVLLTAVLFGSYHLYQGVLGAGSALVFGLVYGAIFCWSRRLWPLVAAHTFSNLRAYIGPMG